MKLKTDEEYIKDSSNCPGCGSGDLEGSSFDINTGSCGQRVDCSACGLSWFDEYRLIGFTLYEETTPPALAEQLTRHLSAEEKKARR